jgi:hypothetical protein
MTIIVRVVMEQDVVEPAMKQDGFKRSFCGLNYN